MTGGGDVISCESEAYAWCVVVDALVLAGVDLEGLVPDSDGAIGADAAVEGCPCRKMVGVAILRVSDEMVEAAPVLRDHDSTPVDGGMRAEEAGVGNGVEFAQHGWHSCCGRYPFVEGQRAVNAHADKEDDEGAFDVGGVASWEDFAHNSSGREVSVAIRWGCTTEGFDDVCLYATL